jgi:hypothetical protein
MKGFVPLNPMLQSQVALLRRHSPETVALVTSLLSEDLKAAQWPAFNRAAWGFESGLHQRLDVSHRDDPCRVRKPRSIRVMGMFRRFSNSLFMHWFSRQKPHARPPPTLSAP